MNRRSRERAARRMAQGHAAVLLRKRASEMSGMEGEAMESIANELQRRSEGKKVTAESRMQGALVVLRVASEGSERLHEQYVTFLEMPRRGRLFRCEDRQGRPFKTASVETEPRDLGKGRLLFSTKDTHYLLEF